MRFEKPRSLPIDWKCKVVGSARSGVEVKDDGRIHCWIEHETVKGVTPEMLVWWFKHLEGDIEIGGVKYNRYRVWHPHDHIFAEYAKRQPDGSVGVGSVIHLAEMLNADPRYLVHIYSEIVKLDETGYVHQPHMHGLRLAEMRYSFEKVGEGTKYVNSLTIGLKGVWGWLLNPIIRRFVFDAERGRAWIRHNIEEVGNFEYFLPQLFKLESGV